MKYRHFLAISLLICTLFSSGVAAAFGLTYQITGIDDPAKANALLDLQALQSKLPQPLTQPAIEHFYRAAPGEIKKSIEPYGYFKSDVRAHLSYYKNQANMIFNVIPGPVLRIVDVELKISGDGSRDHSFQRYIANFPIQKGQPLNIDLYEKTKQALFDRAAQRGFFQAKMTQSKVFINTEKNQAVVVIYFDTGTRSRFGETVFNPGPLSETFLRRFLTYSEGSYYSSKQLQKTQQDLMASNYFQQVIVNPNTSPVVNDEIPIQITLVPRPTKQYTFGVGYGTDTGFRGTFGLTLRRLNSYGHRLSLLLQGSQSNSQLSASYFIPGTHPAKDQYVFTGALGHINQVTGHSNSGKVSASIVKGLGEDWLQTIALTYLIENYELVKPMFISTHAQVVYPSIGWHILKADNLLKPKNGFKISIDVAGAPDLFSANQVSGFFQARGDAKFITSFWHNRLLLRATVGSTLIRNITNLPLSLQLFAGGTSSIRGFNFNSIGPGRYLMVGSIELQQQIKGDWYIGAFVDAGNVTDNSNLSGLNVGVGPALIWLSPIGALELSVAKPVCVAKNLFLLPKDRKWNVQFSMGTDL